MTARIIQFPAAFVSPEQREAESLVTYLAFVADNPQEARNSRELALAEKLQRRLQERREREQ